MTPRHIAVLDVGKTNVKLVLVDGLALRETKVLSRPNRVLRTPPYPHYDTDGIWAFLLDGMRTLQAEAAIDAITVTTHGASAVLLDAQGSLAAPVIDYEHDGPDALAAAYDGLRPPFDETGSPRLPRGLNAGAQIHWQLARDRGLDARLAQVVTYPQYWTGRLSGRFHTEVTSLGAHTDLWNPALRRFSSLVDRLGLGTRMAPLAAADARLGPVLPGVAAATGLAPATAVFCGIHDSNASLYPHLLNRRPPFAVVSTGTWVIVLAVGATRPLDPARDTLMNVNAMGDPVPSTRFMGGREFEQVCGPSPAIPDPAEIAAVLASGTMLFPSVEPTSGPFMGRPAAWSRVPATPGERSAAASFYLALMTATCLRLAGAEGPVLTEGPFARNPLFLDMLAVASGLPVGPSTAATGTAIGAALLAGGTAPPAAAPTARIPPLRDALSAYASAWHDHLARNPGRGTGLLSGGDRDSVGH